jgi:hypothetical protein
MRQKTWSDADLVAAPSHDGGDKRGAGNHGEDRFDALLQAATLAAGGEAVGTTCTTGLPPWWTRGA